MGLAIIYSRACIGVEAPQVAVEVHIGKFNQQLIGIYPRYMDIVDLNKLFSGHFCSSKTMEFLMTGDRKQKKYTVRPSWDGHEFPQKYLF